MIWKHAAISQCENCNLSVKTFVKAVIQSDEAENSTTASRSHHLMRTLIQSGSAAFGLGSGLFGEKHIHSPEPSPDPDAFQLQAWALNVKLLFLLIKSCLRHLSSHNHLVRNSPPHADMKLTVTQWQRRRGGLMHHKTRSEHFVSAARHRAETSLWEQLGRLGGKAAGRFWWTEQTEL